MADFTREEIEEKLEEYVEMLAAREEEEDEFIDEPEEEIQAAIRKNSCRAKKMKTQTTRRMKLWTKSK